MTMTARSTSPPTLAVAHVTYQTSIDITTGAVGRRAIAAG
jgi:hypothetical protein